MLLHNHYPADSKARKLQKSRIAKAKRTKRSDGGHAKQLISVALLALLRNRSTATPRTVTRVLGPTGKLEPILN
jgi:hypothetical protein